MAAQLPSDLCCYMHMAGAGSMNRWQGQSRGQCCSARERWLRVVGGSKACAICTAEVAASWPALGLWRAAHGTGQEL